MFASKQWRERKQEVRPTGRQPPAGVMKRPGQKMSHETQHMRRLQLLLDLVKLVASNRFFPSVQVVGTFTSDRVEGLT